MDTNARFFYQRDILNLTLKLYSLEYLNRENVQEILDIFDDFIANSVLLNIKKDIEECKVESVEDFRDKMDIILYDNKKPFREFDTEKKNIRHVPEALWIFGTNQILRDTQKQHKQWNSRTRRSSFFAFNRSTQDIT